MPDYPKLVEEKRKEQSALDQRMQTDSDLLYLKPYVMTDKGGKNVIPDIVNVTLNQPAIFFANVVSSLGSAVQQVVVTSDDEKIETHKIENFKDAAFASANARLLGKGLPLLNPFADVQFCARGRTARRVLFRMEKGVLIPDIMPWDGRYVYYELGQEGLLWAAYETVRPKGLIEAEYGIVIVGKEGKVLDVYDTEHNEVWIDGTRVSSNRDGSSRLEEHSYGFTPVVVQIVSLGYGGMLLDGNHLVHEGESIFFLIRDIIPEFNRFVSILETLNFKTVKPPMKQIKRGGGVPSEYGDVTDSGTITGMDIGENIEPVNFGDALRCTQLLGPMIQKALQEGSYTDIDIGNVQQPFSAVALITIGESKDVVHLPRLAAKELLNIQTAEMFTKQVIQIGGTIELGTPGHKAKYNTRDLEGEYETDYKYFIKSPKIDIARMSIAQAAREWYPRKHIYTEVLQCEDPEGLEQAWYSQLAEKIDPNILTHRIIMNMLQLAEDGDENAAMEAKIMATDMGMSIAQVKAGITPPAPGTEPSPEPIVPLLPKGQVGGIIPSSAQRASQLQRTPQEEE